MPRERIITLYNSIDMETTISNLFTKHEARKKLSIPEKALIIGTIGRLVPDKDQKTMIYAFASIRPRFPHAKLLIIGEGELEQDLKQLVEKLHLPQDVIFTGFLPGANRYLKAFDIFLLPSVEEAFGRVLLEAMVARVPLIGTRIDGIPEVIGDAGLIFEAGDSHMLSSAILTYLNLTTEDFAAMGDKGYERVKALFSTDQFRKDFGKLGLIE